MKKKVLLTSIMTIVLCMCLIAGSTYALFTSTSKLDVSVESGKVNMLANIESLKLWSVEADPQAVDPEKVVDENGHIYKYVDRTTEGFFTNGGDAEFKDAVLTMERVTPGDKVSFTLTGANTSNVSIQYRYIIECISGYELMSGFNVYINTVKYESLDSYTTAWAALPAETDMADVAIEIELPVTAGNEYQNLEAEIRITVEAIQGNAVTEDPDTLITYITRAASAEDVANALADPDVDYVCLGSEIEGKLVLDGDISNKTIDVLEHDIPLEFTGKLDNVVIKNVVDVDGDATNCSIDLDSAEGNVTIADSTITDNPAREFAAVRVCANVDVTVDNCVFYGNAGSSTYAVWGTSCGDVVITNCTFNNFGSWAVLVNGTVYGDLIVRDCTFNNCVEGLVKAGVGSAGTPGTVTGDFIFVGNDMVNCAPHDQVATKWFGVKYEGVADIADNTLDGADWAPTTSNGITDTVPNT